MADEIPRSSPTCAYPDLSLSSFAPQKDAPHSVSTSRDSQTTCAGDGKLWNDSQEDSASMQREPFRTPLGFYIPQELMENARKAPKGTEPSFWQYGLYRAADDMKRKVTVHYCKTFEQMEKTCRGFKNEEIVGLDLEWKASSSLTDGIKRNVSLIQIASEERVGLFHIARFAGDSVDELVSPALREILESPAIIKAGVAIKGDCTRLKTFLGVQCHGLFELSHLYKVLRRCHDDSFVVNKILVSLGTQVQDHLGLPLLKDAVQTSNWWSKDLDLEQAKYAASDAYACFQLFHHMEAQRLSLDPPPPRPAAAELNQPLISAAKEIPAEESADLSDESSDSFYTVTSEEDLDSITNDLTDMSLDDAVSVRSNNKEVMNQCMPAVTNTTRTGLTTSKALVPRSQELDAANQWVTIYRAENRENCTLQPAQLRAYHLWHHQSLSVGQVSEVLRDPPLKPQTVIHYVCEAVYRGNLPALPRNVAVIGQLGIEPVKTYHRQMIRTASRIVDRESRSSQEDASVNGHVGWWKTPKR